MNRSRNFRFWIGWLKGVSVGFSVFGFVLAFLNQTAIFDRLLNQNIDPVFYGPSSLSYGEMFFRQWVYGLLGATCVLVGILIFFMVRHAYSKGEKWAWNGILVGLLAWFVMDTPISFYFKVYFNVAFNIVLLAAVLVPLCMTKNEFKQ